MAKKIYTAVAVQVYGGCFAALVMQDAAGDYWLGRSTLGRESMRPVRPLGVDDAASKITDILRSGGHTDRSDLRAAFGDGRPGALARVCAALDA